MAFRPRTRSTPATPWWAWLALAVASYLVLHEISLRPFGPGAAGLAPHAPTLAEAFVHGACILGQYVLPILFAWRAIRSGIESLAPLRALVHGTAPARGASFDEPAPQPFAPADWSPPLLDTLEPRRFEEVCAAYFACLGLRAGIVPCHPDRDSDLPLLTDGGDKPDVLVLCAPWRSKPVGIEQAKELERLMADHDVGQGALVASGQVSWEARAYARGRNLRLIDEVDLIAQVRALPPDAQRGLLAIATRP